MESDSTSWRGGDQEVKVRPDRRRAPGSALPSTDVDKRQSMVETRQSRVVSRWPGRGVGSKAHTIGRQWPRDKAPWNRSRHTSAVQSSVVSRQSSAARASVGGPHFAGGQSVAGRAVVARRSRSAAVGGRQSSVASRSVGRSSLVDRRSAVVGGNSVGGRRPGGPSLIDRRPAVGRWVSRSGGHRRSVVSRRSAARGSSVVGCLSTARSRALELYQQLR
jgi:hypothetical protein